MAKLTSKSPSRRSGNDPVAQELIAALQPSFDDGEAGAENSDYDADDERRIGWPHNIVSLDTVATPTGIVHLHSSEVDHEPPPGELEHCRALAVELVATLGELRPFGGDSPTPFRPFYLVIGKEDPVPKKLTSKVIRAAFRETLFPDTPIKVHPITQREFVAQEGNEWKPFAAWVAKQKNLSHVSYIDVGYDTSQEPNLAAVFPRLVLGLTKAGSLVGACGTIVQA